MTDLPRITETWHWYEGNYVAGESPYMGRSNFGKWVTVEHAAHVICEYQRRLAAADALLRTASVSELVKRAVKEAANERQ